MGESREVFPSEGIELAKKWEIPFFETSVKTPVNINESFEALGYEAVASGRIKIVETLPKKQKKKKCAVM